MRLVVGGNAAGGSGGACLRDVTKLRLIKNVRVSSADGVVIVATDSSGADVELRLPIGEVPRLAESLLCCCAVACNPTSPHFDITVGGCYLPITSWAVSGTGINGEPLLSLMVRGGSRLAFQMSSQAALECGRALVDEGLPTSSNTGTH
jgi:hypothetical protein